MPSIPDALQPRLWSYMGGIARSNDLKALAIGGIANHAHVLLSLPAAIAVAKAIQLVKAGSSKWMHEQTRSRHFDWQEGYAAFSIGASQVAATIRYIDRQAAHHQKISPEKEWEMFLKRHAVYMD
jgi:REP-associated tyrosine transposase